MIISKIRLSGWRSFSPTEPVQMDSLEQVNLVIGPNNVGKSNIGRFLVRVRDILRSRGFQALNMEAPGLDIFRPFKEPFGAAEADHWLRDDEAVRCELDIYPTSLNTPWEIPPWVLTASGKLRVEITMKIQHGGSEPEGILSLIPLAGGDRHIFCEMDGSLWTLQASGSYQNKPAGLAGEKYRFLSLIVAKFLATRIYEVKALRDPRRNGVGVDGSTDGGEIIQQLLKSQKDLNRQREWTKQKSDLERWLSTLLGERDLRIDINESGLWIDTRRGEGRFRCALQDLGAGVSEMVMLLAYLRLCPNEPILVVLDEPEAHLHPGAAIELVNILAKNFGSHQLIITTHSTALIDAVTPKWRTFRAMRSATGGALLEVLNTTSSELAVLADLGIRPSQVFLTRSVFWVEGPSDIIYWSALMKSVDPDLLPGRDFSFVIYGGASAAHLDLNDEDDNERLIQVLKISSRSIIVCDRDRKANEEDRKLLIRLQKAAEQQKESVRVVASVGREIENDVLQEAFCCALVQVRPTRINKPELIDLEYHPYIIGADDDFNSIVANAAKRADGKELTEQQRKRIMERLDAEKFRIARLVCLSASGGQVFVEKALESAKKVADWIR